MLDGRYSVQRKIGEGTFGKVFICEDLRAAERGRKSKVAVKVIRNIQKYRDAAMLEIQALDDIAAHDHDDRSGCIR